MGNLLRHRKFTVAEVLGAEVEQHDKKWSVIPSLGVYINTNALLMWKKHGVFCCVDKCERTGLFFAAERTPGKGSMYNEWHLNLYAVDPNDDEVLMTQDHVLARGNGGEDHVDNLQPMCYPHNQRKGDTQMSDFITRVSETNHQQERAQNKKNEKALLAEVKALLAEASFILTEDYILSRRNGPCVVVKTQLTPEIIEKITLMGVQITPFISPIKRENAVTETHGE